MIALMKRILNVAGGYKGRIQLAFVFSFLKSLLAKAPIGMAFLVLTAFLDGSAGSRLCLTMGAAMAICLVMQVLCSQKSGWSWGRTCVSCPWATLPRETSEKSALYSPPIWCLLRKTA